MVMDWYLKMCGVSFLGGGPRLKSFVVVECGFGRGLVNRVGVVGAGRICGSLKGILIRQA